MEDVLLMGYDNVWFPDSPWSLWRWMGGGGQTSVAHPIGDIHQLERRTWRGNQLMGRLWLCLCLNGCVYLKWLAQAKQASTVTKNNWLWREITQEDDFPILSLRWKHLQLKHRPKEQVFLLGIATEWPSSAFYCWAPTNTCGRKCSVALSDIFCIVNMSDQTEEWLSCHPNDINMQPQGEEFNPRPQSLPGRQKKTGSPFP